ncbi:MAG: ABC transporter ATP-binding protein [Syntrophorhabdaceae bacterium]|nr:ABC transporter ATP-binding protein [Syntrophorhabdaceae bacterium]
MDILVVEDLHKSFGGVKAVDDISFKVRESEVLGIIGPNGAGKSTLFNLITGLYRPDKGHIKYRGKEITRTKPFKLAHMGISRTFQNLRLFNNLTVFENILSPMLIKKGYGPLSAIFRTERFFINESKAEARARELIDFFQLTGKEDYKASSLPYGEQRKLELARALSTEPKLLLIDEPGAGMNPKEIQVFVDTLKELKNKFSLTMLIIEHQMSLVMNISERIMVMDFGKKLMEGTPDEVKKDKRVIEAYLGEEID